MKIGILSLNPGHNYGGILQSYALMTILERMGHEVRVISRIRYMTVWSPKMFLKYAVRAFRRLILRQPFGIFYEKGQNDWINKTYGKMLAFCKKKLHLRLVKSFAEVKETEFDAIVVGSDQVWRPKYFKSQYQATVADAYLKFAVSWNIKRVAYAPSFGVDDWEYTPEETRECAYLLQKFDAISVRELSAVRICKKHLNADVINLCDPTMLLSKENYETLVDVSTPKSKGNLLVYCLDQSEELDRLVCKISKDKHLTPFSTNAALECQKGSVEAWIRGFMDAEFVITDSFHACVFSLIFHKPFIVFGNQNRGMSRFETLLSTFGQSERLLFQADEYSEEKKYPTYEHVDEVFFQLRQKANKFLNDSLQ